MDPAWLFLVFLRASLLSLGGQSALPLLREDLLGARVLTDAQIIEALTIGRLSTGPGGLYIVALGFMIAGWPGAVLALLAVAIPPLLVLPASTLLRPRLLQRRVNGLMRGLTLTTSGLVIATSVNLLLPGEGPGYVQWWQLGLLGLGVAVGVQGRTHPALVVGVAAVTGIVLGSR